MTSPSLRKANMEVVGMTNQGFSKGKWLRIPLMIGVAVSLRVWCCGDTGVNKKLELRGQDLTGRQKMPAYRKIRVKNGIGDRAPADTADRSGEVTRG